MKTLCEGCGTVIRGGNPDGSGGWIGHAGVSSVSERELCGKCLNAEAWEEDECPDCRGEVVWSEDETTTSESTYVGCCENCGVRFVAHLVTKFSHVERS